MTETRLFRLTKKQRLIMREIMLGTKNEDGVTVEWLDLDQLLERLSYETTKESIQFSIRALIGRGMIEKGKMELRRGRVRRVLQPTNLAFDKLTTIAPATPKVYEDGDFVEYH